MARGSGRTGHSDRIINLSGFTSYLYQDDQEGGIFEAGRGKLGRDNRRITKAEWRKIGLGKKVQT